MTARASEGPFDSLLREFSKANRDYGSQILWLVGFDCLPNSDKWSAEESNVQDALGISLPYRKSVTERIQEEQRLWFVLFGTSLFEVQQGGMRFLELAREAMTIGTLHEIFPPELSAAADEWCWQIHQELQGTRLASRLGNHVSYQPFLASIELLKRLHARPRVELKDCEHGDDFRTVIWHGRSYNFTVNQALVVRVLWEHSERGTPDVGSQTLLSAVDHEAPPARMDVLFRGNPAWGKMIVAGSTKASYCLAKP